MQVIGYLLVALLSFAFGYFLRSKGELKLGTGKNLPGHRNAPPPPPPSKLTTKRGHLKPGNYSGYASNTFTKVNQCKNCKTIGLEYEMFELNPCPNCGGSVGSFGAAKWGVIDGENQWILSEV